MIGAFAGLDLTERAAQKNREDHHLHYCAPGDHEWKHEGPGSNCIAPWALPCGDHSGQD